MNIFVPGRICLFGEHSDWAGGYRRINSGLEKGYTIITGTNQGINAEVKPHPTKFIINSTLNDGTHVDSLKIDMERDKLLEIAQRGDFFSYACGVAYQIITNYQVRGLEINNYLTDLPIKKGLSSSAAICVLVARAFNRIYDLKTTIRGEMEYAYQGEISTPSRCGRMDQGCAYGDRPIFMIFDGDKTDVRKIKVAKDLFFIIVDLNASKDTKEILAKLNSCYPFAENDIQKNVQKYLGEINKRIIDEAICSIENGDAEQIGRLMRTSQDEFDKYIQPACPSQLTAPILHKVLNFTPIQPYIFGGKGVGSQGDGAAQLIVKDKNYQKKVIEILKKELNLSCLTLTLKSNKEVRRAVIPAAGFGTRLFPASKALKKELFPIVDRTGIIKPIILSIVEEAIKSGIEEAAIIIQKNDRKIFEDLFYKPPSVENFNRLSKENQKYSDYLLSLGHRVKLIIQDVQDGYGHAVYCAHEWAESEPFLLMLSDHLHVSLNDISCTRQLMDIYERYCTNCVGLQVINKEDLTSFGCVTGIWKEKETVLNITSFCEKPGIEYANEHLHVEGIGSDNFLALSGQYVLNPNIFHYLEEHIKHNFRERGEFQLTSALDEMRKEESFIGYVIQGKSYDTGVPAKYLNALIELSGHNE